MSRNEPARRALRVIGGFLAFFLTGSAHPQPTGAVVILEASREEIAAVRALGAGVQFFTARARPLRRLSDIRQPGVEVGSADLELARGLMSLLRVGGVAFRGGSYDLLTLASDNQLGSLFRRTRDLRLLVLRARPGGAERAILAGGGVPLSFRAAGSGELVGSAEPPQANQAAVVGPSRPEGEVRTSFGRLQRVQRAATARARQWERVNATVAEKRARPGAVFVILQIDRDFSSGVGKVAFLFGSGIILEPDFGQLVLLEAGGKRHRPAVVHADGPTLEIAYEVSAAARNLRLEDGDARWPLPEQLASAGGP